MSTVRVRDGPPYDPLAQLAEHLTFNQGVPRSNRGWITNGEVSEWFKELVLKTSDFERVSPNQHLSDLMLRGFFDMLTSKKES